MCGIAGIVPARPGGTVNEAVLLAMRDALRHRGPDEAGLHIADGIGLGHRRLSIIDLSHGQQPMVDAEAGLALVYNGELYNFEALRKQLEAAGITFQTRCDTEVLLRAWQHWGEACLPRLRGMFAFGLWDARQRRVFLARDPIGIKPLYYGFTRRGDLVFASELKGLTAHPDLARELDPQALEDYLALGYVPDPKCIYRNVHKLPPGHWLSWRAGAGEPVVHGYWDVPFKLDAGIGLPDAMARLRELLDTAVASQMVADVPLGAFLSGGVDSSAVVASMARGARGPIHTCAIGFNQKGFDETRYARAVAARFHTNHFEERVDSDDHDLLDTLAGLYDEPFADSSALPTYRVCELARRHVTVTLSGDGGDENFAGYRRYRLHAAESRLRGIWPAALRAPLFGALGRLYPKADWAPRVLRAKTTLQALARDDVAAYFHGVSTTPAALRAQLYSAGFTRELQGYDALEVFRAHAVRAPTHEPLALAQYLDFKTWLPGDILTKVDRASMAHSLEVRVPVLDQDLVEWASSLPAGLKLHHGEGKYVFKKMLEPDLPREVLYRPKMGFRVPLAAWFRGPLRDQLQHAIGGGALTACGWFEPRTLDTLVRQHLSGRRDHSATLWKLLMLDAFLRRENGASGAAPDMASPAPPGGGRGMSLTPVSSHATTATPAAPAPPPGPHRTIRLLVFTSLYPNAEQPRHGIFVEERLRHLVDAGQIRATVVAPVPWFPFKHPRFGTYAKYARIPPRDERHGITILHPRYPVIPKVGMNLAPFLMARAVQSTVRELLARQERYDLIDAHYLYPDGVAAVTLARDLGKPVVMTARGSDVTLIPKQSMPRQKILHAVQAADATITVSAALRDGLVDLGADGERIEVLRNGVDLVAFQPVPAQALRTSLGLTGPTWLAVGNLVELKGVHLVIPALQQSPEVTLLVIGDGPEQQALHALASRLGVAERVRFLGAIPHDDLSTYYSAADALMLASSREGMPNVALEALACGTPVVAAPFAGANEVVATPVAGEIATSRTPEALDAAWRTLWARRPERAATRQFAESLGWGPVVAAQYALYARVLAAHGAHATGTGT